MQKLILDVFFGIPSNELLPMAKQTGFDGFFVGQEAASFENEIAPLYEFAQKENLMIETMHSTIPGCYDVWVEGKAGEDYIQILKKNIDHCAKFSIPILVVHVQVKDGVENHMHLGIRRLCDVVAYAKENDVRIAFENINAPELLFGVMNHFADDHVGFCYDCGHEICHTPQTEFLPILGERLFCVHLHDNDGAGDLHQLPFDGQLDFERICRQLRGCGYEGNITLELSYTSDYRAIMEPDIFIQEAFERANRIKTMLFA